MSNIIDQQKSPADTYGKAIGVDPVMVEKETADYTAHLSQHLMEADQYEWPCDHLQGKWTGLVWPSDISEALHDPRTGVSEDALIREGLLSVTLPTSFVRSSLLLIGKLIFKLPDDTSKIAKTYRGSQ